MATKKQPAKKKEKMPKDFSLIKAIRSDKLHKANVKRRDTVARKYVDEHIEARGPKTLIPGQLVMFNYFEPKTQEQLEYYDAMPCVIFFNIVKNKKGEKRVLGFNLHYYPPKIRFNVMDRIMEIFKNVYKESWNKELDKEVSYFHYEMLIYQLQKAKLDFGVRMYIPNLIDRIQPIPPKDWQKAVFTEGRFKKRTREAIMAYWKQRKVDDMLNRRATKAGQKTQP